MKVFIPILCLASLAVAEPPVGDGYPAAQSHNHHDHGHDHHDHSSNHQTPSHKYGPPSSRNAPFDGYDYNSPNSRTQSRFPPATVRVSFNQRFSSAAARSSNSAARSHHQQPASSTPLSQEYGPPASRSLSQEYGTPVSSARTLSTEYGVPNSRSAPSEEYGVPVLAARSSQKDSFFGISTRSLSHENSPASRSYTGAQSRSFSAGSNKISDDYSHKSTFSSRNAPSSTYIPSSRSVSNVPSTRNTQASDLVSQVYGSPSQEPSETYGVPDARSLSQEYGVPSSHSNQKTDAVTSAYPSAKSSPSAKYQPAARGSPSQQYGVPNKDNQGYDYAQARALNELLNQEPASYDFGYQIEDQESGSDFGHSETREADKTEGSYFVVLPDGTKQTVEYEADERGFKPRISVEPAAAGYDQNAQDLARSQGPY